MSTTGTRHELCRALAGALGPAPDPRVCRLLGLPPPPGAAAHTEVFVLETHPYASVHLGAEGMIGGEAGDRVAGFWRALGAVPPTESDHLGTLLELYADLGAQELALDDTDHRRAALRSARAALRWEHLASWVPVHLASVHRVGEPFHRAWARLVADALVAEASQPAPRAELPTALAVAPPPLEMSSREGFCEAVLAPVRSGMVVTRADLVQAGRDLGLGVRRGERRFTLDALLDQDAAGVLDWLAQLAATWAELHDRWHPAAWRLVGRWWSDRARTAAAVLADAAAGVAA